MKAYCVISDSGTITEESSILGFKAITIRQAHERPEGMDEGTLVMSGLSKTDILKSVSLTINHFKTDYRPEVVKDYKNRNVSKKIVKIVMSYTNYINRTVWNKGI